METATISKVLLCFVLVIAGIGSFLFSEVVFGVFFSSFHFKYSSLLLNFDMFFPINFKKRVLKIGYFLRPYYEINTT